MARFSERDYLAGICGPTYSTGEVEIVIIPYPG